MQTSNPGPVAELDQARKLIEASAADWGPDIFKAAVSAVPLLGGAAAFLIEQRPHTQLKRVVAYLRLLHDEVVRLGVDGPQLEVQLKELPEAANLFERGMVAATSCTTVARIVRLAAVVANGLGEDEVASANAARLLRVLDEVDDAEFLVLSVVERERFVALWYGSDYAWKDDGKITLVAEGGRDRPPLPAELSSWRLPDLSIALNHLAGLGLIEANMAQHSEKDGAVRSYVATPAGAELLRICLAN